MGITNFAPQILDPVPGGKKLVDMMDWVINWARANSLWPLTYGTSCCAIEMMSSSMPRYDIARFGSEVFRASPRQADLFIIAGTVTEKMAPALKSLWEQIPGPKYAIAMGACTVSGGPFYYDNYYVVRGADRIIPVDVFIPGCPPRPEALFQGIMTLRDKIRKESSRTPWHEGEVNKSPELDRWSEAAAAWAELERIKDAEMAATRAQFKEANPDYKSDYKAVRIVKEAMPEVPRPAPKAIGLSHGEIWKLARAAYPQISLFRLPEATEETVAALPADQPLDFVVPKSEWIAFARFLKEHPLIQADYLIDVTAVDWGDLFDEDVLDKAERFDVIAQLLSTSKGHKIFLRCPLEKKQNVPEEQKATSLLASIPSLVELWPAAEWKEREVYDFFGIDFTGHPDLRRLFLTEDFVGFPLRKDFKHPHMIKRPT